MLAATRTHRNQPVTSFDKDRAVAEQCEKVSLELYKQIIEALPDARSRELFSSYSLLLTGRHTLAHEIHTDTARARGVYEWALKKARKLLGK